MAHSQLLPCPFCGSNAITNSGDWAKGAKYFKIMCSSKCDVYFSEKTRELAIEKWNTRAVTKKAQILDCVPYQTCPVCVGVGRYQNHEFGLSGDTNLYETCRICQGAGIIPMHVLPEGLSVE